MSRESGEKPDILIVTVTPVEQDAVLRNFKTVAGESVQRGAYLDLGIINSARVWMVISGMGSDGITGSAMTMQKAIEETSPKVIIMVGIAFGVDEQKQQIGSVLVSEFVVPYENQRVGKRNIELRGARPPASPELVPIFKTAAAKWREEETAPIEFGPILSGNKLINNLKFREKLVKATSAIGGEMEGAGLCFVASAKKTDWILVKGICDWADGKKNDDEKNNQALAAENSARFTLYVLRNNILARHVSDLFEQAGMHLDNIVITKIPVEKGFLVSGITEIRNGLGSARYKDAVDAGKIISEQLNGQSEHEDTEMELLLSEFWIYYALALIYSEGASKGIFASLDRIIARLEDRNQLYLKQDASTQRRFRLILGRAYNHLGYGYWMDKGHYIAALEKFNKAKEYFIAGSWKQELATTYDNLARVYAQLGFRLQAEFLCAHSLRLREEDYNNYKKDNLENQYRLALSLNSSAIIHLLYGHSWRAYLESERALSFFRNCVLEKGERGVGLALITLGNAFRLLGGHWQFASNTNSSKDYLHQAVVSLEEAEGIFKRVDEDIRLLHVYNELGCVYREYHILYNKIGQEEDADKAGEKAQQYFGKIVNVSENAHKYPLIFVDTCHNLAQTLHGIDGNNAFELKKYLEMAEQYVPAEYKIGANHPKTIVPIVGCVEDYWQNLGKVYILKGNIAYEEIPALGTSPEIQSFRHQKLSQAFEAYIMAAGYFSRYLELPAMNDISTIQEKQELEIHFQYSQNLYQRLSMLHPEDIKFVKNDIYERTIKANGLEPTWIDRFFKQSFDLLIRKSDVSN